jgi:zinc/manganese transport system permease protein
MAVVVLGALAVVARPLLFASVDPAVAAARGIPVGLLGTGFVVLLGVAAAATSQITGSLLVFALLVLPAATAQKVTARPVVGVAVAVALALTVTWLGLTLAYWSSYPIGFYVSTIAFALYVLAGAAPRVVHAVGRSQ